jgi:hypothetical protein
MKLPRVMHEIISTFGFLFIPFGVVAKTRRATTTLSLLRLARRTTGNSNVEAISCMTVKIFALLVLLGGCGSFPAGEKTPAEPGKLATQNDGPIAASDGKVNISNNGKDKEKHKTESKNTRMEQTYLSVADWLMQRKSVCQQNYEAIDAELEHYQENFAGDFSINGQTGTVQVYSRLKALMLASCNPARTPGLLNNFLSTITRYTDWPPEYTALFDLLESEYQAYALLEEKYRELETRHQKTIDGIGNIEKSLEYEMEPRN